VVVLGSLVCAFQFPCMGWGVMHGKNCEFSRLSAAPVSRLHLISWQLP
jgi:hypothetical protein